MPAVITERKDITKRLQAIDALRGLAALIVLLYHARMMLWVGLKETWNQYGLSINPNAWLAYLTIPVSFCGGLAVSLFFVLSGYCIHRRGAKQLANESRPSINLKQFALRRLWRLYPTYLAALLLTALVDSFVFSASDRALTTGYDLSLPTFVASLFALQGLAAPYFGSNGVFWTLALELHFYLLYPILFYGSRRYGPKLVLLTTLIISASYSCFDLSFNLTSWLPYRGAFNPIFLPAWFTWTFGFYLAEVEADRTQLPSDRWLFLLLSFVFTSAAMLLKLHNFAGITSTVLVGELLIWSLSANGSIFWGGWFGRVLASVGEFSYSLYATHVPLILLLKFFLMPTGQRWIDFIPVVATCFAVMGFSWFMFLLVERWTLKPIRFDFLKA
jgi:peptidoglycan/LPS O-acetylase OafA/YrhL